MKKILLFSLMLSTSFSFAQLFVRPNPGNNTDSYVYSKGEVIYVTSDVNLQKNSAGDTEASIYLREGGQLIQGGTTSTNKGNGFLSVQQKTKPTNAYAYYYWCSPVGNPTLSSSGNTNFGLGSIYEDKNSIIGVGTKASLSANIAAKEGFSSPLTISRRWVTIMTTPGTEQYGSYVNVNAANAVPPGFGFTMKGVNDGNAGSNTANTTLEQTYEFRGRPNNGDFVIPISAPIQNPGSSGTDPAMTLAGNPYPSALDLIKVFEDNPYLDAIYFYDEDRSVMSHFYNQKPYGYGVWTPGDPVNYSNPNYPGLYAAASFNIWNAAGQTGTNPVGTGLGSNYKRYAPVGQGFMLVGGSSTPSGATVTIKNSHRVFQKEGTSNNSIFFKTPSDADQHDELSMQMPEGTAGRAMPGQTLAPELDSRPSQLRLFVVFDDALTRDLLLWFSPNASDGYERGFDALSPLGMKSDAYFPIDNNGERKPYVIQGTNFQSNKMVPLTLSLHKASQVEIRIAEEVRKPYQQAYLFDQQENTYRPLRKGHSLAGTLFLPAGKYENRFYIVFREKNKSLTSSAQTANKMSIKDALQANVGVFQNNPVKQLEINNPEGHKLSSLAVFDMSGKLVISEKNIGDSTHLSFYTGNLSDGIYLVKVITADDVVLDYKTRIINK